MAFSWVSPLNWFRARRHVAFRFYDSTDRKRDRWVNMRMEDWDPSGNFVLRRPLDDEFAFLLLGDTGEGDASQAVLVDKLQMEADDAAFTIIAGDVVYPSGRSADYRTKFYVPYRNLGHDIYAVPGNHDWYDELAGFLVHFCDSNRKLRAPDQPVISAEKLEGLRRIRRNEHVQPNMYFSIDHPRIRIVCIDTGARGGLGRTQEEWLRRISADPRPKVLIAGFPFYVDGGPGPIRRSVRSIVDEGNYVLVVGADRHNFQAYEVPKGDRSVWHLVNGGGGAYGSHTYRIPLLRQMDLDGNGLQPKYFTCYPPPTVEPPSGGLPGKLLMLPSTWLHRLPAWAVDEDAAPYRRSFVKVAVRSDHLHVEAFGVQDFGRAHADEPHFWDTTIPL